MRSLILVACASLAFAPLASCDTTGTVGQSPAPLTKIVQDDRAVRGLFLSLDTIATLVDQAVAAKLIVPGSAQANRIADALVRAKAAVNAASHAQKAGSVSSYNEAIDQATQAIADARTAVGK